MLEDLKNFLFRGNIVELAVAFVMGVAFAAVINSLVDNLVMPIVAMIIGKPDFSDLTFTINDAVFRYGAFITDAITFVATAAAVFFFIVKPMNALEKRRQAGDEPAAPTTKTCTECASIIPLAARRCPNCTQPQL